MLPHPHLYIATGNAPDFIHEHAERRVLDVVSRLGGTDDRALIRRLERNHELGCLGEWAVCAMLGLPWIPAARAQVDIPPDIQVRTTTRIYGQLPHYTTDRQDQRYVLVIARDYPATLSGEVMGWVWGTECRVPVWREQDRWNGWAVPKAGLRMPGTLAVPDTPPPPDDPREFRWSRYA